MMDLGSIKKAVRGSDRFQGGKEMGAARPRENYCNHFLKDDKDTLGPCSKER